MYTHTHSLSHSGYIRCFHISQIIYITACDIFCPMHSGNSTECGLLKMANILGNEGKPIDYKCVDEKHWIYKIIREKYPEGADGYKQNSFSSTRKRMSTRVKLSNGKFLNTQAQTHMSTHTHTHMNTLFEMKYLAVCWTFLETSKRYYYVGGTGCTARIQRLNTTN